MEDVNYSREELRFLSLVANQVALAIDAALNFEASQQATDFLLASEERLRLMVNTIPGLVVTMTAEGELEYVSQQCLDYFGKTLDELKGWTTSDIVHPDDLSRVLDTWRRSVETGHPYDAEYRIRRSDLVYRWFNVRALPLRDTEGHIIRWYALHTNNDDRKQAEEKLERSQASLAEAQTLSHCGSWSWNVSTREGFWSQEMFRILGYDPEETKPSLADFLARIHPEDRLMVEQVVKQEMSGLQADLRSDYRILLADGTIRHLHAIAHPVKNGSGEIVEVIGTSMDVTGQRLARAELESAFEAIKFLKDRLHDENLALKEQIDQVFMFEDIIGSSTALRSVLEGIQIVVPVDSTVLIQGETGTGKELIARAIHNLSPGKNYPFVKVNCAAIPSCFSKAICLATRKALSPVQLLKSLEDSSWRTRERCFWTKSPIYRSNCNRSF
jgi:PAS domain S-box-containing protein